MKGAAAIVTPAQGTGETPIVMMASNLVGNGEMDCSGARKLLSAYRDDELPPEVRSSVAEHVPGCSCCTDELEVFETLSRMAKRLDDPEPPKELWRQIESELDAEGRNAAIDAYSARWRRLPQSRRVALLATAALVMIAAGVVWVASRTWPASVHHRQLAANFGEYLEHFPHSPDAAQRILLASYEGQAVSLSQAATHLGYRPAVAADLPEPYSLDAVYILKMPCCTCVQSVFRREDGEVFAVFEHDEEQLVWFGDRPRISAQSNGRPCEVIQFQERLAASWKDSGRYFTIVGARNLEEIAFLMTHFQASVSQGWRRIRSQKEPDSHTPAR